MMILEEYIRLYYKPELGFAKRGLRDSSVCMGSMPLYEKSKFDEADYEIDHKLEQSECLCLGKTPSFQTESPFPNFFYELLKEKGIEKPMEVYKKCLMTKQTFSRIMNPRNHPSKHSVLALCIGLELDKIKSVELLARAGFAFNPADLRDVIVQYFIEIENYDIDEINRELHYYGEDVFGNQKEED